MVKNDPAIDQIREIRHKISQKFNNDPEKVVEFYIQFQKKYRHRLINLSKRTKDIPEKMAKI